MLEEVLSMILSLQVLRQTKHLLPHIAHLCLVGTFIEDGFRMFSQWGEQRDYMDSQWNCGWWVWTKFSCGILLPVWFGCFTLSSLSGRFIQLRILAVGPCNNLCSSVFNIYSLLQANKSSFFSILLGLPAKGNYMMVGLIIWPFKFSSWWVSV